MTEDRKYDFLLPWTNKIKVTTALDDETFSPWVTYTGHITTENLRWVLPNEVVIEFDTKKEGDKDEPTAEVVRAEALLWIEKLKTFFLDRKTSFKITDHGGKSPHFRFIINNLENYTEEIRTEYKKHVIDKILQAIKFESKILQPDKSLTTNHMLALEFKPHFKKKYNGAIEEVIFENNDTNLIVEIEDLKLSEQQATIYAKQHEITQDELEFGKIFISWLKGNPLSPDMDRSTVVLKNIVYFLCDAEKNYDTIYKTCEEIIEKWPDKSKHVLFKKNVARWIKTFNSGEKRFNPLEINKWISKFNIKTINIFSPKAKEINIIFVDKYWGTFNDEHKFYAERIDEFTFICNHNGTIEITQIKSEPKDEKHDTFFIQTESGIKCILKSPHKKNMFYNNNVPSIKDCNTAVENLQLYTKEPTELISDIKKIYELLYEFNTNIDKETLILSVLQSYLKPFLESFFFVGIDSTKGGGKTTLLEITALMSRHGFVAGDISTASIPRLVDSWDLTCFLDEIDQSINKGEDDKVSLIRKGQRRGNPYIRCEGKNFEPKAYEVCGGHVFTFRSEIEDAFASRAIPCHTSPSKDNRLPIVNSVKQSVIKPLSSKMFFSFFVNMWKYYDVYSEINNKVKSISQELLAGNDAIDKRQILYTTIIESIELDDNEKSLLNEISGRNVELLFDILKIEKILGYKPNIEYLKLFKEKEEDDALGDNYFLSALKNILIEKYISAVKHEGDDTFKKLEKGEYKGNYCASKNTIYDSLVQKLTDRKIPSALIPTSKKYNSLIKDVGFITKESVSKQKYKGHPEWCLVITNKILGKLKINSEGEYIDNTILTADKEKPEKTEEEKKQHTLVDSAKELAKNFGIETSN